MPNLYLGYIETTSCAPLCLSQALDLIFIFNARDGSLLIPVAGGEAVGLEG